MFVTEEEKEAHEEIHARVKIGSLAGKGYSIPDDFNEPLEDLKEYM
jgi:hypothetical protein